MSDISIAFRVDASFNIGLGHFYRCLTLAKALCESGSMVEFISRDHLGAINEQVKTQGYKVSVLPLPIKDKKQEDLKGYEKLLGVSQEIDSNETIQALKNRNIDWLIVDHYALDYRWEEKLRPYCKKIMVIDDMANRKHSCDILLDQTYRRIEEDYKQLVSKGCKLLLGSEYAQLRTEFVKYRERALQYREKNHKINDILISMGGMDDENITLRILDAIDLIKLETTLNVIVVLGSGAPNLKNIKRNLHKYNFNVNLLIDVTNMAALMSKVDLAIGAGGTTSWERCCLGLPTILIVISEDQMKIGQNLSEIGAVITLQKNNTMEELIRKSINVLSKDRIKYLEMCHCSAKVCDGNGTKRTVEQVMKVDIGNNNDI